MAQKNKYPASLKNSPLQEAWLEIKWNPSILPSPSPFSDPYPATVSSFYDSIKNEFGSVEELPTSKIPGGMLPQIVQHRFRPKENQWPLLQFGQGVASVNLTKSYTWQVFKKDALYLLEKIAHVYRATHLVPDSILLHYRNFFPYDYNNYSITSFLQKLKINLNFPEGVPGEFVEPIHPTQTNVILEYGLKDPKGFAQMQIGTGIFQESFQGPENKGVIWGLVAGAVKSDLPDIYNKATMDDWLERVHSVLHEWFFTMVDGELLKEFNERE